VFTKLPSSSSSSSSSLLFSEAVVVVVAFATDSAILFVVAAATAAESELEGRLDAYSKACGTALQSNVVQLVYNWLMLELFLMLLTLFTLIRGGDFVYIIVIFDVAVIVDVIVIDMDFGVETIVIIIVQCAVSEIRSDAF
jgi:hypothetical protein